MIHIKKNNKMGSWKEKDKNCESVSLDFDFY